MPDLFRPTNRREAMQKRLKIDSGTTSFASRADRFVKGGYQKQYDFAAQMEMLSKVRGITGVALDYPSQYEDPVALRKILDSLGLELGMTEIDMYSKPQWMFGSLSSNDDATRKSAIELVKRGIDAAIAARGADVQLWLGQDGYDYPFQSNLNDNWSRLIEAIEEIAAYRPEMKLTIEYKIKEPRCRCYISTVGKALFICERTGRSNVGITLDTGHSLMALENPAESAVLAMKFNRLFHLHLNDNYRDWDHDMIPGTVNLWETLELFYWLRKMNFSGWYGIDIYPYREEGAKALEQTVKNIYKFMEMAEQLQKTDIEEMQKQNDVTGIVEMLRKEILA